MTKTKICLPVLDMNIWLFGYSFDVFHSQQANHPDHIIMIKHTCNHYSELLALELQAHFKGLFFHTTFVVTHIISSTNQATVTPWLHMPPSLVHNLWITAFFFSFLKCMFFGIQLLQ